MRALLVPIVAASLVLASCGNPRGSQARSVAADIKPSDVIVGTWTIKREDSLNPHIQGYEFAADNTVKVTLFGAKQPIMGKYAFANDYTLEMEYDADEAARKAYANAVGAYKKSDRIPDQLPAKEKLTIAVKSVKTGDKPGFEMIVENEKNFSLIYRKAE
jgi:hypothetical protein